MRRPDPIALQRLEALSAPPARPPLSAAPARPPQVGWPAEPWDLDAWPDVPPSLDAWPEAAPGLDAWPEAAPGLDAWPIRRSVPPDRTSPEQPARSRPAEPLDPAPARPPRTGPAPAGLADPVTAWSPPAGLAEHARAALLARLPAPLRAGRFDPGRRGAYVVGAIGVLAAVAAVAFAVHGRAEAVAPATPVARTAAVATGADPIAGGVTVEVDVEGRVRRPGLVSLPSGSRVADALARAGGVLPATSTRALDLAAKVTDGQQLVVGLTAAPAAATAAASAGPGATSTGTPSALVDLNTATADQLDALPHIGPATAAKIVAWRTAHGPFAAVTDLQQVSGIGPATYQDIAPLVTV